MLNRSIINGILVTLLVVSSTSIADEQQMPWVSMLLSSSISVNGTINVASGLAVDNDVNDPLGQNGPKNDPGNQALCPAPGQPQEIPNPVTVAGYVNLPNQGTFGVSYGSGDLDDYYLVDLKAGQTITLNIADPVAGDLDLDLLNASCTFLLDRSSGTGQSEQIFIFFDGAYLINVYPFSGASNYTLTIGQATGAVASSPTLMSDFVSGEAIVTLSNQQGFPAGAAGAQAAAEVYSMNAAAGAPERAMLWKFNPQNYAEAQVGKSRDPVTAAARRSRVPAGLLDKFDTLQAIKTLRQRSGIERAEPNYTIAPAQVPNDTLYPRQWHYPQINLPQAWDITTGTTAGNDIIVAVLDTGILLNHPDFQGRLVPGYDFIRDLTTAKDGNGIDPDPSDPGDEGDAGGLSTFHGAHVAGTVAAATNNGIGVAGVAWGAKIMPLRVLGVGGGNFYDMQQACLFAAGLPNDSGTVPAQRADVINMSIQAYSAFNQSFQNVMTQVRNAGVIIVACSGNRNERTHSWPASFEGVVSVAAVDMVKNKAPYSNFHNTVDIAAPGGDTSQDLNGDGFTDGVLSIKADDSNPTFQMNYDFMQGTSMASPHVAGVAALMEAAARNAATPYDLTPDQFDTLIATGAITEDIGTPGKDEQFGHGLIDALKSVQEAGQTALSTPTLVVNPTSLNFGTNLTAIRLTADNAGPGFINIFSVTANASWLTLTNEGPGRYIVSAARGGLAAGTYTANISFISDANNVTVPVIMTVTSASSGNTANAGFHYVLLVDEDGEVQAQVNVAAQSDGYKYDLKGKTETKYTVVAGTDFDNDGYICDGGEACGSYLTLDQQKVIESSGDDLNQLDFYTGFLVKFTLEPALVNDSLIRRPIPLLYKKRDKPMPAK